MFTPGKRQVWECITLETLCLQRQRVGPFSCGLRCKGKSATFQEGICCDILRMNPFAFFFFGIGIELIYSVVLISGVQPSDSVIHMFILFQILFPYRLSQKIRQSSLCYTVGPCWLSISCIVLCCAQLLSLVWLFMTSCTIACQAPLSMGVLQA